MAPITFTVGNGNASASSATNDSTVATQNTAPLITGINPYAATPQSPNALPLPGGTATAAAPATTTTAPASSTTTSPVASTTAPAVSTGSAAPVANTGASATNTSVTAANANVSQGANVPWSSNFNAAQYLTQYGPDSLSTNDEAPSSSASAVTSHNANVASTSASNPSTTSADANWANAASQSLNASQGLTGAAAISASTLQGLLTATNGDYSAAMSLALQGSQSVQAQQATDQQDSEQASQYAAANASQSQQFQIASQQLETDRAKSISTATAQLGAVSGGTLNSDQNAFMAGINSQYDTAQNTLMSQDAAATDALSQGNAQAYQAIQAQMEQTKQTLATNVANILNSSAANQQQASEFATQQADTVANQQATQQANQMKIADTELSSIPAATGQALSALPTTDPSTPAGTAGAWTAAQLATLQGAPGYQSLIKGGLNPQQALGYIQSAANGNAETAKQQTIANQAVTAQAAAENAQANYYSKLGTEADNSTWQSLPMGGDFQAAINTVATTNSQKATLSSSISSLLAAGNTDAAKIALSNAALNPKGVTTGFNSALQNVAVMAMAAAPLIADINALPASQKSGLLNGSIQSLASSLGQNPDPALQKIGMELAHFAPIYAASVVGVRGASQTAQGKGTFADLIPNMKDGASLSITDLQALVSTATDLTNSALQAKLDPATYQAIYGNGLGNGLGSSSSSSFISPSTSSLAQSLGITL